MSVVGNRKIDGIREYSEGMDVEFGETVASEFSEAPPGRKVIIAYNEGGYNFVQIDFEDMRKWILAHPEGL
ncbi:MAG: hypothetical protein WBY53_00060 [Acidobacteriaceae bacterium]